MWICGSKTITTGDDSCIIASALRCKSWECEECFGFRLHLLQQLAASGKPSTFLTLTASPECADTPDRAAQVLVHAWRMIVQRAKRDGVINGIEYLCVFESTMAGQPHLHILARTGYIPQPWLSLRAMEYARSPIVDIRHVASAKQAAVYIAKYVTKGPGKFDGTKRYWRSQHWVVDESELPCAHPVADHWAQMEPGDLTDTVDWYERHGWYAHPLSPRRIELTPMGNTPWPWMESMDRSMDCVGPPRWVPPCLHRGGYPHDD